MVIYLSSRERVAAAGALDERRWAGCWLLLLRRSLRHGHGSKILGFCVLELHPTVAKQAPARHVRKLANLSHEKKGAYTPPNVSASRHIFAFPAISYELKGVRIFRIKRFSYLWNLERFSYLWIQKVFYLYPKDSFPASSRRHPPPPTLLQLKY